MNSHSITIVLGYLLQFINNDGNRLILRDLVAISNWSTYTKTERVSSEADVFMKQLKALTFKLYVDN